MLHTGLFELNAVAAISAHRSFRAAATQLGISPSALSHAIAGLEVQAAAVFLLHVDREGGAARLRRFDGGVRDEAMGERGGPGAECEEQVFFIHEGDHVAVPGCLECGLEYVLGRVAVGFLYRFGTSRGRKQQHKGDGDQKCFSHGWAPWKAFRQPA